MEPAPAYSDHFCRSRWGSGRDLPHCGLRGQSSPDFKFLFSGFFADALACYFLDLIHSLYFVRHPSCIKTCYTMGH